MLPIGGGALQAGVDRACRFGFASLGLPQGIVMNRDFGA